MRRKFVKMQGAGNDYIYFDCLREPLEGAEALAVRLSDRHKGIGGDGIVLICPSAEADARMRMFNADGSEGNMCGNAIRCVAKYLFDAGIARKEELTIETRSGIKRLRILPRGENGAFRVRVDMGPAVFEAARIPVRTEAAEFVRGKVEAGAPSRRPASRWATRTVSCSRTPTGWTFRTSARCSSRTPSSPNASTRSLSKRRGSAR